MEHRASFRLKRQAVLFRKDPLPYRAVIHEAALHMRFGGRDVTRRQLKHSPPSAAKASPASTSPQPPAPSI
ncbi:Scr1 family TA system antitoxin-like transcriptional regulator [Streptomyces tendae]|uniref:Scr1 family TA system antitoxin-like transcriptional regulator n=1 Tax=Streptomyces tendae TaxID=1932 RepID=UPI0033ACF8D9